MTDLEKQIQELVARERFEEAAALKNWHKPSGSITEAVIRWIDSKRTGKHEHEWAFEQQRWFWVCGNETILKDHQHGTIHGRMLTYKCSCGERKVIKTI